MPVREIVRLGHPALREAARPVAAEEISGEAIQGLIDDLIDTMRAGGGVGLAAPQIGVGQQVFVYAAPESEPEIPLRVIVNPLLEPGGGELVYEWEGCLSIPDLRGLVPRHQEVRVRATGRDGEALEFDARGFEARILQHEFDHLNGVVFLDRMRDLKSLAFEAEWERFLGTASRSARAVE